MADTSYTIDVQAQGIGTDATADEIVALSDRMEAAERVITRFDGALEAAGARLAEAAMASEKANAALSEAEARYSQLERAASSAAKKVERAAAAGKDTTQLQAAADAAAQAVREQAQAVDMAAAEAKAAASAQERLAKAYRNVDKAASRAAEETRGTQRSFGDLFGAAGALGGPLGGLAGQISGIGDGLRAGGTKGGLIFLAFGAANALITLTKATVALGIGLIGVTALLLKFAVAADEATSKRLEKAWERAGKRAKALFEGVKTEKLVRPVESLLRLLDKNTSAGKGLAKIFETLLNPIIDGFDKGEPLIKEFFKGMILGALRAINFVLRLRNAIVGAIPKETREKIKDFAAKLLSLGNAAKAGEGTFKVLALAVGALALAFALLGISMLIPIGILALFTVVPILIIIAAVKKLGEVFRGTGKDAKAGGEEAGSSFVSGIIDGITAGIGAIVKAAKAAVKAAIGGANEEADSHSPSKVMMAFGRNDFAGGMVIGMHRAEPEVRQAGKRLGRSGIEGARELPRPSPGQQSQQTGGAPGRARPMSGGQVNVTVSPGGIVINASSGDAPEIAQEVRRVLQAEIDGAALQLGGGEVAMGTT